MRVGILNSGGDVQGINAVISSIVKSGARQNSEVEFVGFMRGWEGILDKDFITLDFEAVRGISHVGGTILHSVNRGRFSGKVGSGNLNLIPEQVLVEAKQNLDEAGIDALIVIGGDGTLSAAMQLANIGVNIVGVPKTIDNDLNSTDQTFGFSTAVQIGMEAIDRVRTTARSHDRVIFVETMGRHVGWIGLYAGLAGGAHGILLPEFDFSYQSLIDFFRERRERGLTYSVIVVAEGAKAEEEDVSTLQLVDSSEIKLGGISAKIMHTINQIAPAEFEMRNVVLGHTQRGGSPNAEDRILAKAYGVAAYEAVVAKKFGHMVCSRDQGIVTVPITEAVSSLNRVTKDTRAYRTANSLGIFLGQ